MGLRSFAVRASPLKLALLVAGASLSCATDFDASRPSSGQKNTLGEEIYTAFCDRVGASSLTEDLSGASYRSICHKEAKGWVGTTVNEKLLPPASRAPEARRLAVAKLEAMARHRAELIEAFDATIPDKQIPDPLDPKKTVRLPDALDTFFQRLTPLYESSPFATAQRPQPPTIPASTQALGALFESLATSDKSREAFARISGREGYRPASRALGTLRSLLAYPELRRFTRLLLERIGKGAPLEQPFQQFLRVAEQELRTFQPEPTLSPPTVDPARLQPDRPRFKLEILGSLLLHEDDAFARGKSGQNLALRDLRGFALPHGTSLGVKAPLPAPFADKNGDGAADVDLLGRFLDASGEPLGIAPPFATPGVLFTEGYSFDSEGKALFQGKPLYAYGDASRMLLHAVLDDLRPLTVADGEGHSTLMSALEGSYLLFGARKDASREYGSGDARVTVPYRAFDTSASPLLDLTHATGQLLGAPESDDFLGSILAIHEKHPEKTARVLQLAWAIWNRSKNPEYAQAVLADSSTFWEEMTDWLAKVARVGPEFFTAKPGAQPPRGLLGDLTLALVQPAALKYLPGAFVGPMRSTDRIGYNPANINGPPANKTGNFALKEGSSAFQKKVDRSLPDQGDNRSAFQRFARIIAASRQVNACNRQDTLVKSSLEICGFNINLTYPLKLPLQEQKYIGECDLFDIKDLGVFFVDSTLPWDHPRRARLQIKDSTLTGLLGTVDDLVPGFCGELDIDTVLQASTGIRGLSTVPTPQALMRLVFFGSEAFDQNGKQLVPQGALDPLLGGQNKALNTFLVNAMGLVGTGSCPKNAKGVNVCADYAQTLRGIEPDTFFVAETPYLAQHPAECLTHCASSSGKLREFCEAECNGPSSGFFEGLRPTLSAFASYSYQGAPGEECPRDAQNRCLGEQLFLDLMGILDRHWSSAGSSLFRYEDLLAWVLGESDLFGAAGDLLTTMDSFPYVSPRVQQGQPRSPIAITTSLIRFLFDPQIAASFNVTDRKGNKATITNDGKTKAQATPYDLFVQSLRGFDRAFDEAGDAAKKARWKGARSALVDQFLLAEGGAWKNPAIARAMTIGGQLLREQINANCSDREASKQCSWARSELATKLQEVVEGPLFAAVLDLNEALRADEEMRIELGKFLSYMLDEGNDAEAFAQTLTSLADLLQVLHNEDDLAPILRALAPGVAPGALFDKGKPTPSERPGAVTVTLDMVRAVMAEPEDPTLRIDRYLALDEVLPRLVNPPALGKRAPLEVFFDAIESIQRVDSSQRGAFSPDDHRALSEGLRRLLVDEVRGMEQFYTIVRGRNGN